MDMKLERSLGADELHDLYAYIDRYIDGKFQSNVENERRFVQNEFSLKIAQAINENLNKYQYQLSESDIELISERIKNQLKDDANLFVGNQQQQTVYISNILLKNREFLTEIENVVKGAISAEGNEAITKKQEVLTASIVGKVLASDVLANLISTQVSGSNDINQLKLQLSQLKQQNHYNQFNDLIDMKYKAIVDELYKFKLENDEKQGKLLNDIDVKLASFGQTHFQKIDENIKDTVLNILGFDAGDNNQINDVNVKSWIQSMFVAKEHLEARLKEMVVNADINAKNEIDKNSGILMKEVNEQIQKQIVLAIRASEKERESGSGDGGGGGSLTVEDVKRIVKEILAIYDADKTGIVDYALESAGGQILSTRCTEKYQDKSGQISIFGIPIWYHSNTPRIAISPNVQPGECWAFSSFPGFLVIQLYSLVYISGFTIEHIPKSLSPNGKIDSAPANFSVWGLKAEIDDNPVLFGNYMYLDDESAPSLQYFPVLNKEIKEPFQVVELRIESNHGHPKYTCLYRFRVHGKPQR